MREPEQGSLRGAAHFISDGVEAREAETHGREEAVDPVRAHAGQDQRASRAAEGSRKAVSTHPITALPARFASRSPKTHTSSSPCAAAKPPLSGLAAPRKNAPLSPSLLFLLRALCFSTCTRTDELVLAAVHAGRGCVASGERADEGEG